MDRAKEGQIEDYYRVLAMAMVIEFRQNKGYTVEGNAEELSDFLVELINFIEILVCKRTMPSLYEAMRESLIALESEKKRRKNEIKKQDSEFIWK
jgi:hypothetical protein|tara:strand:- start:2126 stop:2410 length:285 start_codon:yes stop_codon:yes gene_type:complete